MSTTMFLETRLCFFEKAGTGESFFVRGLMQVSEAASERIEEEGFLSAFVPEGQTFFASSLLPPPRSLGTETSFS